MKSSSLRVIGRSVTTLTLGAALILGGTSLAGASGRHGHDQAGNCASARVSSFSYASAGTGGYVTAVSATSVTVAQWNGTTTTFTLTPTTTYTEGRATTTIASLVVGDRVIIRSASGAPTTATAVTIELAELFGKVSAVSGSTISITDSQGFTRTIVTSASTTFTMGSAAATLANVTVGSRILATGTIDTNGTSLDALTVKIGTSGSMLTLHGTVAGASATGLSLTSSNGTTTSIAYTPTTTFSNGTTTLTSANVTVGEHVDVEVNSAAATTALKVKIHLASLTGTVTSVSATSFTVSKDGGPVRTVMVGTTTTYTSGGTSSTYAAVVTGATVSVKGTIDADGTSLDALVISIATSPSHDNHGNRGNHGYGNGRHRGGSPRGGHR